MHTLDALIAAAVTLVGLGFVMGFSPTLYAVLLRLLTHSTRPVRMSHWMVLGIALASVFLVLLFQVFDPQTLIRVLPGEIDSFLVQRSVDITAGVLLLIAGFVELHRSRRPRKPRRPKPERDVSRPSRLVLLGFAETVVSLSGVGTMYIAERLMRSVSRHWWELLGLYAVFLVALVGPYLLAVWAWGAFPAIGRWVERWTAWVARRNARPLIAWILIAAGVIFFAQGIFLYEPAPTCSCVQQPRP